MSEALIKEAREILSVLDSQGLLTSTSSLITRLADRLEEVERQIESARAEEREACAQTAYGAIKPQTIGEANVIDTICAAIRSRPHHTGEQAG